MQNETPEPPHIPAPLYRYVLLIAYDGTGYSGWQVQRDRPDLTIQAEFLRAFREITGEVPSFTGSGRTDAGVHASGQVAHVGFRNRKWDAQILFRALNSKLPPTIRVLRCVDAPEGFHAQRSAERKQYSYYWLDSPCAIPQFSKLSCWVRQGILDSGLMHEASQILIGSHDFRPFQASGATPMKTTIRSILEADVTTIALDQATFPLGVWDQIPGARFIRLRLVGTGFLKQMVRGIAGTLVQVGRGDQPVTRIQEILDSQDRQKVGPTAPGRGLWLDRVWYRVEAL